MCRGCAPTFVEGRKLGAHGSSPHARSAAPAQHCFLALLPQEDPAQRPSARELYSALYACPPTDGASGSSSSQGELRVPPAPTRRRSLASINNVSGRGRKASVFALVAWAVKGETPGCLSAISAGFQCHCVCTAATIWNWGGAKHHTGGRDRCSHFLLPASAPALACSCRRPAAHAPPASAACLSRWTAPRRRWPPLTSPSSSSVSTLRASGWSWGRARLARCGPCLALPGPAAGSPGKGLA